MKTKRHHLFTALALLVLATLNVQFAIACAQGTAFTYQGRLNDGASAASGKTYGMVFYLYDAPTNGNQLGNLGIVSVTVSHGLFTLPLDFGNVFDGNPRWLEISVQKNGGGFTKLNPRQPVMPAPSALFAPAAGLAAFATTAAGAKAVAGTNLNGVFRLTQLPGAVVTNSQSRLTLAGVFTGNGGGITNVPGAVPWFVSADNVKAVPNTGYLLTNASLTMVTLPPTSALHVGDIVRVTDTGAGGWELLQNGGQSVLGNSGAYPLPATTVGSSGYLSGLQDSAVTVEYIGNSQFVRVNAQGVISVH
jgi:hypothetical protein